MKQISPILTIVSFVALSSACVDDSSFESAEYAVNNSPTSREQIDVPRGSKVVMSAQQEQDLVESGARIGGSIAQAGETIVYMNRMGGQFTPGNNNSSTNSTTLASQTVNFPAANLSDGSWNQIMGCVRQQFSQFNIVVTDVDPGATPHFESVIGGSPELLGMPSGVGGVSPFTSNCDIIPRSIVFSFTDVLPDNPQVICEVAAQEIAHSFGLDHEYLCADPMSYLSGCGAKSFQNEPAPCGEFSARACAAEQYDCGYAQQNSVELLTQRIGLKVDDGTGDFAAAISAPSNGAQVSMGFVVTVESNDASSVELRIDGTVVSTLNSPPFVFDTDTGLSEGEHSIEIIATSPSGSASDMIVVTLLGDDGGGGGGGGNGTGGGDDGTGGGNAGEDTSGDPILVTGGCSTSNGGSGSAALLLLLSIAAFGFRRRELM